MLYAGQLWDWLATIVDQRRWSAVKVFDKDFRGIDSQMVVDRGQEVIRSADTVDGIFPFAVCCSDESTGFNPAACPDV